MEPGWTTRVIAKAPRTMPRTIWSKPRSGPQPIASSTPSTALRSRARTATKAIPSAMVTIVSTTGGVSPGGMRWMLGADASPPIAATIGSTSRPSVVSSASAEMSARTPRTIGPSHRDGGASCADFGISPGRRRNGKRTANASANIIALPRTATTVATMPAR